MDCLLTQTFWPPYSYPRLPSREQLGKSFPIRTTRFFFSDLQGYLLVSCSSRSTVCWVFSKPAVSLVPVLTIFHLNYRNIRFMNHLPGIKCKCMLSLSHNFFRQRFKIRFRFWPILFFYSIELVIFFLATQDRCFVCGFLTGPWHPPLVESPPNVQSGRMFSSF